MIHCTHCGAANTPAAEICQACGEPLATPPPRPRLLAQIQGLIPAEPAITAPLPGVDAAPASADPVPVTAPAPALPPPPPLPPPSPTKAAAPGSPLPLALLLIAAILLGLLWPEKSRPLPIPRRPDVDRAFAHIAALPAGARVLLAWEYDPTTQGEMQLLAEPILLHLRRQRAGAATVSLRPFGPAVAADAYAASERLPAAAGLFSPPPVELGFIPGQAAALRALAIAPIGAANLPELSGQALNLAADAPLTAFDLIILFSAEPAAGREWVEQVTARQPIPLIVAASGAAAPALRPYAQTGQITALLGGYTDALAYESLLGLPAGRAAGQMQAQSWAHGLLLILALAALVRRGER